MPTYTTNYSLPKPNVNSADDEDLWGDQLNDGMDLIDTNLKTVSDVADSAATDATSALANNPPSGMVAPFAMSTAPSGWLECDGSAVSRTTYAALFTAIGTTFGVGDGATTFNIPDLRGEFIRGWDNGAGVDSGRTFGSNQSEDYLAHKHTSGIPEDNTNQAYYGLNTGLASKLGYTDSGANRTGSQYTSTEGGDETRPRNVALMYCIRT